MPRGLLLLVLLPDTSLRRPGLPGARPLRWSWDHPRSLRSRPSRTSSARVSVGDGPSRRGVEFRPFVRVPDYEGPGKRTSDSTVGHVPTTVPPRPIPSPQKMKRSGVVHPRVCGDDHPEGSLVRVGSRLPDRDRSFTPHEPLLRLTPETSTSLASTVGRRLFRDRGLGTQKPKEIDTSGDGSRFQFLSSLSRTSYIADCVSPTKCLGPPRVLPPPPRDSEGRPELLSGGGPLVEVVEVTSVPPSPETRDRKGALPARRDRDK